VLKMIFILIQLIIDCMAQNPRHGILTSILLGRPAAKALMAEPYLVVPAIRQGVLMVIFFIDITHMRLYGPKGDSGWGSYTNIIGPAGAAGSTGLTGPTGPTGLTGPTGPAGDKGADGRTVLHGPGDPTGGANGDFFIDTTHMRLYGPKTDDGWGLSTSLVGPAGTSGSKGDKGDDGDDGSPGTNGTNGTNGVKWYYGTDEDPDASIGGVPGDYYLNTQSGTVYRMDSDSFYEKIGDFGGFRPAYRYGTTALTFDTFAEYGSESSPVSGNISLASDPDSEVSINIRGVSVMVVHYSSDTPVFDACFQKFKDSLEYYPGRTNYITCNYRSDDLITYRIEYIDEPK